MRGITGTSVRSFRPSIILFGCTSIFALMVSQMSFAQKKTSPPPPPPARTTSAPRSQQRSQPPAAPQVRPSTRQVPQFRGNSTPQPGQRGVIPSTRQVPNQVRQTPTTQAPGIPARAISQRLPNGGVQYRNPNGATVRTNAQNRVVEFHGNGVAARYAGNGQARIIQTSHYGATTTVTRGLGSQRTIETVHPNGVRVVSYGPHVGYTDPALSPEPLLTEDQVRLQPTGRTPSSTVLTTGTFRVSTIGRLSMDG